MPVILLIGVSAYVAVVSGSAYYYQETLGNKLEQDLGFKHGSPYLRFDEKQAGVEVFTLEDITTGGAFAKAGVLSGDIPVTDGVDSITGFYRKLHESRGTTISFVVVKGGRGPAPDKRSRRTISVFVPPK